jgi:hypothetical protein
MHEPAQLSFDVRQRTAVHEAAHAVAARAYGLSISFAEVCADDSSESLGRVRHEAGEGWTDVVVALAGPQGELAFYNDEWGSNHDREHAEQYARKVDPDFSDEVMQAAQTAAAKIIRENRTVISTLAVILERQGKLSGAEIDGIIGSITGINGRVRPAPAGPDMSPLGRARRDRARRDYAGAAFIEKWIWQQEGGRRPLYAQ